MKQPRGPAAPHLKLLCRSIAKELDLLESQPSKGPAPRDQLKQRHQALLKELRSQIEEFAD